MDEVFVSLLTALSCLKLMKGARLPAVIDKYRRADGMGITRIPLVEALSRQAMPVVLNEIMVRTAYFTVRLARELATHEAVAEIDWDGVVPFGDRTIDRMIAAASSKNKNADQLVEDATARLNARREASGRAAGMMSSASNAANILSSMPFLLCLFMRTMFVCQLPQDSGSALRLHPFSMT